jgi:hypothetical protein
MRRMMMIIATTGIMSTVRMGKMRLACKILVKETEKNRKSVDIQTQI